MIPSLPPYHKFLIVDFISLFAQMSLVDGPLREGRRQRNRRHVHILGKSENISPLSLLPSPGFRNGQPHTGHFRFPLPRFTWFLALSVAFNASTNEGECENGNT